MNGTDLNNENVTAYITGGIRGAIFATIMKDLKPQISEPADMQYSSRFIKNNINLLISDYTINTLLFFIQQSGYINIRIQNETNSYLPVNADIEGLKALFPNLSNKYVENFPVEIKINTDASLEQPIISSDTDGSKLSSTLNFELKVYNSTDIFDEPITELKMAVKSHIQVQYMIDDTYLHIIVFKSIVDELQVKINGLEMDEKDIQASTNKILDYLVDAFRPKFADINLEQILENTFGAKFDNLDFDSRKGYLDISVDVLDV